VNLFEKHLKKKRDEKKKPKQPSPLDVKKLDDDSDLSFFQTQSINKIDEEEEIPATVTSETSPLPEIHNALELLERESSPLSTGLPVIDKLLRGGLEPRSITEVYGTFASGKTQFCFQCASQVLKLGKKVMFIDTEGTFRPNRILNFLPGMQNDILRNILTYEARTSEQQIKIIPMIRKKLQKGELALVIIDSLTALFRVEYNGEENLARRQQMINRHLRDILSLAIEFDIPILVTNQVTGTLEKGEWKNIAVGGNIVAHGTTHRLEFMRDSGNLKIVTVRDSPNLPVDTAKFRITSEGLV